MAQLRGVVAEQTSRRGWKSRGDNSKHFPTPYCFSYCCFQVIIALTFSRVCLAVLSFSFSILAAMHGRSQLLAKYNFRKSISISPAISRHFFPQAQRHFFVSSNWAQHRQSQRIIINSTMRLPLITLLLWGFVCFVALVKGQVIVEDVDALNEEAQLKSQKANLSIV